MFLFSSFQQFMKNSTVFGGQTKQFGDLCLNSRKEYSVT